MAMMDRASIDRCSPQFQGVWEEDAQAMATAFMLADKETRGRDYAVYLVGRASCVAAVYRAWEILFGTAAAVAARYYIQGAWWRTVAFERAQRKTSP